MESNERIAILETEMVQVRADVKQILEGQEQLKSQLTKYKGFIGGVAFLGSCMWALIVVVAKKIGF